MTNYNIVITKLACLLLVTAFFMDVNAQAVSKPRAGTRGSWRLLGTVSASHSADHDVILVRGPYDYFRQIKFKVTDAPVNIHRLVVTYDDGGLPENINTRFQIPRGGESRIIDLRGGKRKIRSIEFWYNTKGILNGKADVTVFGIK
jgi:hypothetical protein